MTIGLTDTVAPLGGFPIVNDTDLLGGMRSVADIAARDAIPIEGVESIASRRKEGMLVRVNSNGALYVLGAGLGNGDWQAVTSITQPLDVYLSSAGDDNNDGLSVGAPVATWGRAWEVAADATPAIVHLAGEVGGYVAPPNVITWAIITGDDNFTVLETGIAGASTDAYSVELASAVTADVYRHFTVEFTDGAAVGLRRQIRDNSTTNVFPCAEFGNCASDAVAPSPGDTYRILRPSSKIGVTPTAIGAGPDYFVGLGVDGLTRVDLVNVAINPSVAAAQNFRNRIEAPAFGVWFGVLIEKAYNFDQARGTTYAGIDEFLTYTIAEELLGYVNPGAPPGTWGGWGLGFADATFTGFPNVTGISSFQRTGTGFFYGYVTSGINYVQNAYFFGGSAVRNYVLPLGALTHGASPLNANSFAVPAVPFLLKGVGFNSVGLYCDRMARCHVRYTYGSVNTGVDIRADTGNTFVGGGLISTYGEGSAFSAEGGIKITYTGPQNMPAVNVSAGGDVSYFSDTVNAWSMGSGSFCTLSGGSFAFQNVGFTGANGVVNNGGKVLSVYGSSTLTCTGQAWVQTSGESVVSASMTIAGDSAELIAIQGGGLRQVPGTTLTATNNATGAGDVLRVNAGAQATLLGGANTVLDGSAAASGYGINARGGGRVFTTAQPSSVTGATADLTVGTGGGEDQPDTFLAASFSSLVSGDTLSAIARST